MQITGSVHSPAVPQHAAGRDRPLQPHSGNSPYPASPARKGRRCSPAATAPAAAPRCARSAPGSSAGGCGNACGAVRTQHAPRGDRSGVAPPPPR
ncbi:hypothetical protein G6F59_017192 [Rhizopus arrhizus]|nr:hypothetical protein G6F59_017192 [Rhizopus arrhizus]